MSVENLSLADAPNIRVLLARLRSRIRGYVWMHGLTLLVAAAGVAFWLLLGIDWSFEPSRTARMVLLGVAGGALVYVCYRFLMSRIFVPLSDRSMAVLVERRFPEFRESLLTTIEYGAQANELPDFTRDMLTHTSAEAQRRAESVELGAMFDFRPLRFSITSAVVVTASILALAMLSPDFFRFAMTRIGISTDELYARETRLEIEGFRNGEAVVARGGDFRVVVKADTSMVVPEYGVQIRYQTGSGSRDRRNMIREGTADPAVDPWQFYQYDFQNVLEPIEFEVRGGDDRIRDLRIRVVENPTIASVLYCEYPAYTNLSPRELPVSAINAIAAGARVTVLATGNKDLVSARVTISDSEGLLTSEDLSLLVDGEPSREFSYTLDVLQSDTTLQFELLDADGIRSRDPVKIALTATPDAVPDVSVRLSGIGSAITPQARLALVGRLQDDFGIANFWAESSINDEELRRHTLKTAAGGRVAVDVNEVLEAADLGVEPGQKLVLNTAAADARQLPWAPEPNVGQGERFMLDVVTPEQLRALLETRELNLRQRFETIISEMIETREMLGELELESVAAPAPAAATVGGESPDQGDVLPDEATLTQRRIERNRLRQQRALQNAQKNADETAGVADSFDGIREELVNNRVDTEELRIRLKDNIADPLHLIAQKQFEQFRQTVVALDKPLMTQAADLPDLKQTALVEADALIVEMQRVRDKMLELESFNEAVELLRVILDGNNRVNESTKRAREEKVKRLIQD